MAFKEIAKVSSDRFFLTGGDQVNDKLGSGYLRAQIESWALESESLDTSGRCDLEQVLKKL